MFGKGEIEMFVLQTVIEFAVATLLIVGLFKEQRVVEFEDRVIAFIKRKVRARKTTEPYRSSNSYDRKNCA